MPQRWLRILVSGFALVAAYPLLPAAAQDVLFAVIAVAAFALVVVAIRGRHRRWWVLACGVGGIAAGDVIWLVHTATTGAGPPFPSIADAAYLAGIAAIAVVAARLLAVAPWSRVREALLDAGVVATGGAVILWLLAIEPLLLDASSAPLATVVAISYPVLDLVILGVIAAILLAPHPRVPALYLFAAAGAAQFGADVVYTLDAPTSSYLPGGPADIGWLLAYVLIASALHHPSVRELGRQDRAPAVREDTSNVRILLLWVCVLGATLVAAFVSQQQASQGAVDHVVDIAVVLVGSVIAMATLVLVRLSTTARRLTATLSERTGLRDRLAYEATHDTLTGLENRHRFRIHLDDAGGTDAAVILFDLDRFKEINEYQGHARGDEVLQVVADRIRQALRPADHAARLDGDEFAVLLEGADEAAAAAVARRVLVDIGRPVVVGGEAVTVGASAGVAVRDPARSGQDVLQDAGTALGAAKATLRGGVVVYSDEVRRQALGVMSMERDLREAIRAGQLRVVYQPIVTADTLRTTAAEALLRWDHPTRGPISPAEFIPVAERTGLIEPIGRWVLEEACRTATTWQLPHHPVSVHVNVSALQLRSTAIIAEVAAALDAAGLPAHLLMLELTETTLLEDRQLVVDIMDELRRLGVRFAIDDFGTGYSSLRYLRDLPIDELKIDRAFVAGIDAGPEEAALASAVLHLARTFGMDSVAEGVETIGQLRALAVRGCMYVQGFLVSRPLEPARFAGRLAMERTQEEPSPVPIRRLTSGGAAGADQ